jgi:hypothetical protein
VLFLIQVNLEFKGLISLGVYLNNTKYLNEVGYKQWMGDGLGYFSFGKYHLH